MKCNMKNVVIAQKELWDKIKEEISIDEEDEFIFSRFETWFCNFFLKNKRIPEIKDLIITEIFTNLL